MAHPAALSSQIKGMKLLDVSLQSVTFRERTVADERTEYWRTTDRRTGHRSRELCSWIFRAAYLSLGDGENGRRMTSHCSDCHIVINICALFLRLLLRKADFAALELYLHKETHNQDGEPHSTIHDHSSIVCLSRCICSRLLHTHPVTKASHLGQMTWI